MLKIKLLPRGKKHQITYRIVVAECRSKSDGKFIDDLGFYTPQTKTLELNKEKMAIWQKNGAQTTQGVDKLLNPDKHPNKKKTKKTNNESTESQKPVKEIKTNETTETEVKETVEIKTETIEEVNSEEKKPE
ncbi:MAG: 30S ribosomal protein S16 [Candidatus Shapirobacteria bacterium]|nr:30S ribosomal protein S16 [Candidatus Shapirobacteria bacterium]